MRDTQTSSNQTMLVAGAVVVVLAVGGAVLLLRPHHATPPPAPQQAAQPATVQAAPAQASAPPAGGDCQPPRTAPPMAPDGATATQAQMQAGHAKIQDFVNQLEFYQACRNSQADHAGPEVSDAQKQAWIDQGNGSVDEANLLAHAFAVQVQVFNARGGK